MQVEEEQGDVQEVPKQPHRVSAPTRGEREEHEASGHAAYRAWRRHCVVGKGQQRPHMSQAEESSEVEACFDYIYMGSRDTDGAPILCARETGKGNYAATTVPHTGVGSYAIAYVVAWLKGLGLKRIIMRSDTEASLMQLLDKVSRELSRRGVRASQRAGGRPPGERSRRGGGQGDQEPDQGDLQRVQGEVWQAGARDEPATRVAVEVRDQLREPLQDRQRRPQHRAPAFGQEVEAPGGRVRREGAVPATQAKKTPSAEDRTTSGRGRRCSSPRPACSEESGSTGSRSQGGTNSRSC